MTGGRRCGVWIALAVLVGAAGCGGESDQDGSAASSTDPGGAVVSVPGGTTTVTTPPTTPPSRFEFVDYRVSGGIAGLDDALKVYPDGRVVYISRSTTVNTTVPTATVAELRAALEAANLASLPPVSGSQTPDGFAYRVIFGGQAVRFYDGAIPPSLGPALAILNRVMADAKRSR